MNYHPLYHLFRESEKFSRNLDNFPEQMRWKVVGIVIFDYVFYAPSQLSNYNKKRYIFRHMKHMNGTKFAVPTGELKVDKKSNWGGT
ncbi:MAG: hypothetical protein HGB26_00615 [Desulfobulbaceae bacterium]|nr:hypothetical protein [Desulfobulbaceae bacterium]